jgi:hypothetical protein
MLELTGEDDLCLQYYRECGIWVDQYPAAHLEVEITQSPVDPIDVCTMFDVTAVITNTGEADAWETSAVLSIFPDTSVRISLEDTGPDAGSYVKKLGTIPGHGHPDNSVEVTWRLHCKEPCESNITVSAVGFDEYGYHTKQRWSDYCWDWILDLEPEAGRPIPERFIEPDSVVVKQLDGEDGGGTQPQESGIVDIVLDAGWNLVSIPYYVESGDRAPADLLASIIGSGALNTVYAYDACADPADQWQNFATVGPAGTLTEIRDGAGYWFYMNAADILSIEGSINPEPPALPPTYDVCAGWNLIGFKSDTARTASDYLNGIDFGVIYGFADGGYFLLTGLQDMTPGSGYWAAIFSAGEIFP